MLGSLLDDDALRSAGEERVLQGLVRWMRAGPGGALRGEDLLRKVRFPFMPAVFLADEARMMLPDCAGLEVLVLEAGLLKGMPPHLWPGRELSYLDSRVLAPRRGMAVHWGGHAGGGAVGLAPGPWAYDPRRTSGGGPRELSAGPPLAAAAGGLIRPTGAHGQEARPEDFLWT